jgi:uncharacterized protein YjbI with pentapeptide repeats
MREAARAPVKPRILSSATKAALPLEDEVQALLEQRSQVLVALEGEPGGGKSTALAHLAAVFPQVSRLRLIDVGEGRVDLEYHPDDVIIFVGTSLPIGLPDKRLLLAPWQRDELIEYLLARHPQQTASVIGRISKRDFWEFGGSPAIWRIILDEMALDETLNGPAAALSRNLRGRIPSDEQWEQFGADCLATDADTCAAQDEVLRLLSHRPLRRLMAAEYVATQLKECRLAFRLPAVMSRPLVRAVARCLAGSEPARTRLLTGLLNPDEQPMATSLLYAIVGMFRPPTGYVSNLAGAYLDDIKWAGIELPKVQLANADLSGADLRGAKLDGAEATNTNFSRACLLGASLTGFRAAGADFSDADLTAVEGAVAWFPSAIFAGTNMGGARLWGALFSGADLSSVSLLGATLNEADFREAKLSEVDFTDADLSETNFSNQVLRESCLIGACLRGATLVQADLEGLQLDGGDLRDAQLAGANLTGTSMQGADLSGAVLRDAGLADVDWEGACLCEADLRGASFHLGSSRSGLVGSPIASEGSRTGFYTDDFNEQDFKPPEEIRKANLRNVDLRGANVEGVDFYLVDLRGAKYDAEQAEHFRRTGAILEDRRPE